jgi:hypothetical protein
MLRAMCDHPLILLFVEDEPLREALCFALETEGYAVGVCADGCAAAAVIIDEGAAWPDIAESPTIVLTGDMERFRRRGATGVSLVEKPLLDDALSVRLGELLKPNKPRHPATSSRDPSFRRK